MARTTTASDGRSWRSLATLMGGKGKVGILAGNENAPNLQARAKERPRRQRHIPAFRSLGPSTTAKPRQDATAEMQRANKAHSDLTGWAMVGGMAALRSSLLNDASAKRYKIVAVDALPAETGVRRARRRAGLARAAGVSVGYVGVQTIVDKVRFKAVVPQTNLMKLVRVTKENLKPWAQQLKDWGFKDVPAKYLQ